MGSDANARDCKTVKPGWVSGSRRVRLHDGSPTTMRRLCVADWDVDVQFKRRAVVAAEGSWVEVDPAEKITEEEVR